MLSSCQNSIHNSFLFVNLIHLVASNLVLNAVSSLEHCFCVQCIIVFSGSSKMSRSGSMPTKPVAAPQRGRKPSQVLRIIVECVAVVSKDSSAI